MLGEGLSVILQLLYMILRILLHLETRLEHVSSSCSVAMYMLRSAPRNVGLQNETGSTEEQLAH